MKFRIKYFLVLIVVLSAVRVFAQGEQRTYTLEPSGTIITTTDVLDDVTKYYIHQKNTTGKEIHISWKRLSIDIPSEWDFSLCDLGTCYAGIPEGEFTMFPVEKDSSGFLAPNIYPLGVSGTAKIVMLVWDKDNPLISDTLTWIITAKPQADVQKDVTPLPSLRLFPNPATDNVSIDLGKVSNGIVAVRNLAGASMLQIPVADKTKVNADLSALAGGEYLIVFIGRDGTVLHSKLLKN